MVIPVLFSSTMVSAQLSQQQRDAIASGAEYFNVADLDICTDKASPASTKNNPVTSGLVYMLGDSITAQTEPLYTAKFAEKGYTSFINGLPGRAWLWGHDTNTPTPQGNRQSGKQALQTDADQVKAASAIVIALGSNGGLSVNPIDEIVQDVRALTDAPIWWVNIAITPDWSYEAETNIPAFAAFNTELAAKSPGNYDIVNWYTAINPSGDPSVSPTNDPGGLLADGLHPTDTGENILSDLVISTIGGGGGSNIQPANTTVNAATQSGTFSAIVWGTEKTMDPAWVPILGRAAQRFGVDPAMLAAIQSIETNWASPDSFASSPQRNSATATGPFQFLDGTAVEFMPGPDSLSAIQDLSRYTERVIKKVNDGVNTNPDGSLAIDGNKDNFIDRVTPEDAALMAAAYLKDLGATLATPVGEEGDYRVPKGARGEELTARLVGAYYNQGPGFSAPDAVTKDDVNSRAAGRNDVAHYMDQMSEVTRKGRESGVFNGYYGDFTATGCGSVKVQPTGNAAEYITDCAENDGNAGIACVAINELMGFPYSMEKRAPATADPPEYLDCSALVNMAIYRAYGQDLGGICSAEYLTNSNFMVIDVHDIKPGDMVGRGQACGGEGHIAIVVSYDAAEKKLITVETGSTDHPSGLRGIGGEHGYDVGLLADGNGGRYEWAVRYVGPKS